jgi:hypothetical protein
MTQAASADWPARLAPTAGAGFVSGAPRMILRGEGLAALCLSLAAFSHLGGSWALFAILFLAPDLAMLGYLAGPRIGAVAYNAAHSHLGPAFLAGVGLIAASHTALVVALIWSAHIGFDRLLGYGLKYSTAFGDTHLGRIGKAARA